MANPEKKGIIKELGDVAVKIITVLSAFGIIRHFINADKIKDVVFSRKR